MMAGVVVLRDAARDRQRVVGDGVDVDARTSSAVVHALPADHALVERDCRALWKPPVPAGAPDDARDHQEIAPDERVGNLEEVAFVDLVHRDAAAVGPRAVRDDLRVRARSSARWLRGGAGGGRARRRIGPGCATARRWLRRRRGASRRRSGRGGSWGRGGAWRTAGHEESADDGDANDRHAMSGEGATSGYATIARCRALLLLVVDGRRGPTAPTRADARRAC